MSEKTGLGRLSDVEMELMHTIWGLAAQDAGASSEQRERPAPVTVTALLAIFEGSKGWKNSTISTMLERIISKGFLRKEMQGKANYYHATVSFEEYQRQEGRSLLASLYGGSVKNFVAALADDGGMTDADVQELQEWFTNIASKDGVRA